MPVPRFIKILRNKLKPSANKQAERIIKKNQLLNMQQLNILDPKQKIYH